MNRKTRIVVLTGAGMSAESGIRTFRDNDGLWNDHRVEEVASPVAWEALNELSAMERHAVLVAPDLAPEKMESLKGRGFGFLVADPLTPSAEGGSHPLAAAGVECAAAIILAFPKESDNAFLCLTARDMNPNLKLAAYTLDYSDNMRRKFGKAGARHIISPDVVGGKLLALAGTNPLSTDFIQDVSTASFGLDIAEPKIGKVSVLEGVRLGDVEGKLGVRLLFMGLERGGELLVNPVDSTYLTCGDSLIVVGGRVDLEKLVKACGGA